MKKALNVGAGLADNPSLKLDDGAEDVLWTRLDIDENRKPDVVHDILEPLPPKMIGAYDYVLASHVLEHITWRGALMALNNICQALKPDGKLILLVPDLEWASRQISKGLFGFDVLGVLYGGHDTPWDYHNSGYTKRALATMMDRVGFDILSLVSKPYESRVEDTVSHPYQIECIAKRKQKHG